MTDVPSKPVLRASIGSDQLPAGFPHLERFQLAAAAGFEGVEVPSLTDSEEIEEIREAAAVTGIKVHSVTCDASWSSPLSSADPQVVDRGVRGAWEAMDAAHRFGADTILLVAGRVDRRTSMEDAYARSQRVIREQLLPRAKALSVTIGIENVWEGCLTSPTEYMRYIDELNSPYVRAYLDVGNMVFGHPHHWVRLAGQRIVKLHIKDFAIDASAGRFAWSPIGMGQVEWGLVYRELGAAGFSGWATNTGVPRRFVAKQVERVARILERKGAHRLPFVGHALRVTQRVLAPSSLNRVARHFHRFRAGEFS